MKSILYLVPVVGLLSFGAVVGCGDDSDDGGGTAGTGATGGSGGAGATGGSGGAAGSPACEVTTFTCGSPAPVTSSGACTSQVDAYCADTYGENGDKSISDLTGDCARGPCLSVTDPTENINCVNDCVQAQLTGDGGTATPVSADCTICAAAVANCAKDNCISHCLVDTGCCEPCQEACGCRAEWENCAGLDINVCD